MLQRFPSPIRIVAALVVFISLTALASCHSDARGAFETTLTPMPFGNYDYEYSMLWIRDKIGDLAMGVNLGDFKDTSFGTRFYDGNAGPGEFTCFPDDVVVAEPNGNLEMAYAGYLRWERYVGILENGTTAISSYQHRHDSGWIKKYIEPNILSLYKPIQAEVNVKHTMILGDGFVETEVKIRNEYKVSTKFRWIYQDGAFLYLPDQSQVNVDTITPTSSARYFFERTDPKKKASKWLGQINRAHGISSVVYAPEADYSFTLPQLFLVDFVAYKTCADRGYDCYLSGNDRVVPQQADLGNDFNKLIPSTFPENMTPAAGKIIGVVMDFGELKPGQERTIKFYRFGLTGLHDEAKIRKAIEERIQKIDTLRSSRGASL